MAHEVGHAIEEYALNDIARPIAVDAAAEKVDEAVHNAARSLGIGGVFGSVLDRSVNTVTRSVLDRGAERVTRSVLNPNAGQVSAGVPAGGITAAPVDAQRPGESVGQIPDTVADHGPTIADLLAASDAMRRNRVPHR